VSPPYPPPPKKPNPSGDISLFFFPRVANLTFFLPFLSFKWGIWFGSFGISRAPWVPALRFAMRSRATAFLYLQLYCPSPTGHRLTSPSLFSTVTAAFSPPFQSSTPTPETKQFRPHPAFILLSFFFFPDVISTLLFFPQGFRPTYFFQERVSTIVYTLPLLSDR